MAFNTDRIVSQTMSKTDLNKNEDLSIFSLLVSCKNMSAEGQTRKTIFDSLYQRLRPFGVRLNYDQSGDVQSEGDVVRRVPHPNAPKGLIRINKNGSYQYKVKHREKTQATSMRFATMTAPKVSTTAQGASFASMYGSSPWQLMFDYEWQPFHRFGTVGLQLGTGISILTGNGRLVTTASDTAPGTTLNLRAQEKFTLFIVPVSAFLVYRFEYSSRQWFVPYVLGGGTYYGLFEKRDDKQNISYGSSPAVGGGGGVNISITRWDHKTAFLMDREYGVSDMWMTVEARLMQGLRTDLDFTSTIVSAGISVDY